MNRARIILFCVLAACGYGVVHDQITIRVCLEYFTVAHPPLFPTHSPTLLALCWGIAATWFIGLAFGVILALVSGAGPQAPLPVATLHRPVLTLLAAMGLAACAAGLAGYRLTRGGFIAVPEGLARVTTPERHARFVAAWFAHLASYGVGLIGGALVCYRTWRARGRPLAIALLPRGRAAVARTAVIIAVGAVVWWFRLRAR